MTYSDEFTPEQRQAIIAARRILAPHFAGETLSIYVPLMDPQDRRMRRLQVLEALAAGASVAEVACDFSITQRWVQKIRQSGKVA
jgi:hypothetical protein